MLLVFIYAYWSPNTCTPNGAGIGYISRAPDLTPWYLCVVRVALWSIVLSFFLLFLFDHCMFCTATYGF